MNEITLRETAKRPNNYTHKVRSFLVAQTKIAIGSIIFIVGKAAFHPILFYSSFQAQLNFESRFQNELQLRKKYLKIKDNFNE